MERKNLNQKYLNKVVSIKVIGQGNKDDFFGKIDNIICFIKDAEKSITFGDVVDVQINNVTEKCLFCEVIPDGY